MAVKVSEKGEKHFLLVLLFIGLIWLRAGLEKVMGGTFVDGLPKTLTYFASKNPYPWFVDFINGIVIPNSWVFGWLVILGELVAGVLITGMVLYRLLGMKESPGGRWLLPIGLKVAAVMSLVFFLASGWTGPSTEELNLLMFGVEVVGLWWAWGKMRY